MGVTEYETLKDGFKDFKNILFVKKVIFVMSCRIIMSNNLFKLL